MVKNRKNTTSNSNKLSNKSSLNTNKTLSSSKKEPTIKLQEPKELDDDDYNSGFGKYLRSAEGAQMMTIFVLANSVVIILTMAWPNLKEFYHFIKETFFGEEI